MLTFDILVTTDDAIGALINLTSLSRQIDDPQFLLLTIKRLRRNLNFLFNEAPISKNVNVRHPAHDG